MRNLFIRATSKVGGVELKVVVERKEEQGIILKFGNARERNWRCRWQDQNCLIPELLLTLTWIASMFKVFPSVSTSWLQLCSLTNCLTFLINLCRHVFVRGLSGHGHILCGSLCFIFVNFYFSFGSGGSAVKFHAYFTQDWWCV